MEPHRSLAGSLPDIARYVELRDLLLSGEGEIFGLRDESFVLTDPPSIFTVGSPDIEAVRAAIDAADANEIVAMIEDAERLANALDGWTWQRGVLHELRQPERLPSADVGDVRFIELDAIDAARIPADLWDELVVGAEWSPIVSSFVDGHPVSFCYAGAETETLWDVSIDTLDEYQRQGHASLVAAAMIRHMQGLGKMPVWDAAEDNPPSWRLAQKLGFEPTDELALFAWRI